MSSTMRHLVEATFLTHTGEALGDFVARRRGEGASWRWIARELVAATDGVIQTSDVTLSSWYADQQAAS